jgi:diacylglycerol kinase (ATP)
MRLGYSFIFGMCACLAGYYTWAFEIFWLKILWGNVASSFFVVTVAYAGVGPIMYRKSGNGRLPFWTLLLCWPFFLLSHLLNRITTATSQLSIADEIIDGLYLGRHCSKTEAKRLIRETGIYTAIDLEAEMSESQPLRDLEQYHLLAVLDRQPVPLVVMDKGVGLLKQAMEVGPVFVHCALGRGRSVMLVIAFLLATQREDSVDNALRHVQSCRKGVYLHADQLQALEKYRQGLRSH